MKKTKPRTPNGKVPPNLRLLRVYHQNCRRRNINWRLTPEQFYVLIALPCFYCHRPPYALCRTAGHLYTGIDRIDNQKGYVMGNVVPACSECNGIKSNRLSAKQMTVIARALGLLEALG